MGEGRAIPEKDRRNRRVEEDGAAYGKVVAVQEFEQPRW